MCYKHLSLAILVWPWRRCPRSNLTTSEDSQPMISYRLVSHCKPVGPIIREIKALLKSAMWGILTLHGCPWIKSFKVKCLQGCRGHIYALYISPYEEIQTSTYENQPVENVDNFQRNARSGHLVFQNEANISPREAYLTMKISCKFDEPSWSSFPLRLLMSKISVRVAVA